MRAAAKMLLAGAVMLGGPGAAGAAAAQRYAAPTGSGSACTAQVPCPLLKAVSGAAAGDEVLVAPGQYGSPSVPLSATIAVPNGVSLQGSAAGRPQIYSQASGSALDAHPGAQVHGLMVIYTGRGDGILLEGALGDALIVLARGSRAACENRAGPLRDSVCMVTNGGAGVLDSAASGSATATVRNVTALATGPGSVGIEASGTSNGRPQLVAVNTIAQGATAALATSSGTKAGARLDLSYSSFATSVAHGAGTQVTPAGSATNQTAPALLVNPPAGNFHELATSPTIDAGTNDPANGQYDFESDPRVLGASTDIGADEAPAAPTVVTGEAGPVDRRDARLNGTVNPHGTATTVSFEWGTTTSYGQSIDVPFTSHSGGPVPVQAVIDGLTPGTTYHFRIVASGRGGVANGADATFTTPPLPPGTTQGGVVRLTGADVRAALHLRRPLRLRVKRGQRTLALGSVRDARIRNVLVGLTTRVRLPVHPRRGQRRRLVSVFLGSVRRELAPGRRTSIVVRLTPAGRSLLRSFRTLRLRLEATVQGTHGEQITVAQSARLQVVVPRRPARRRHR